MFSKAPATIQSARISGLLLIALVTLFADAASAAPISVLNGTQFTTTTGTPIQAHGGGVIKVGPYYYWFGENRNPNSTFFAVSCYRSTDLKNWEFRNNVLTANSAAELNPANIERPKVVYNSNTGRYVMWMHWENGVNYGEARAAVASSATVDGNYTYHGSFRPLANTGVVDHGKPGYMSRDCTLFVDSDGTGYFISAANENADLHVYRLTFDYMAIDNLVVKLWVGQKREAPDGRARREQLRIQVEERQQWACRRRAGPFDGGRRPDHAVRGQRRRQPEMEAPIRRRRLFQNRQRKQQQVDGRDFRLDGGRGGDHSVQR